MAIRTTKNKPDEQFLGIFNGHDVKITGINLDAFEDGFNEAEKTRQHSEKTKHNISRGQELAELIKIWCRANKRPIPETEVYFAKSIGRRWKFDIAWPDLKIALEIEGGVYQKNHHHVSVDGYESDCEKYTTAQITYGYRIIRVTYAMHKRGVTLRWLDSALPMIGQDDPMYQVHEK